MWKSASGRNPQFVSALFAWIICRSANFLESSNRGEKPELPGNSSPLTERKPFHQALLLLTVLLCDAIG